MSAPSVLPVDPGLLERMRRAGAEIAWRTAESSSPPSRSKKAGTPARIAHLHDEEARIEERPQAKGWVMVADSGPVGALVLLLTVDRRGLPTRLTTHEAGELTAFAQGAIEARWTDGARPGAYSVPLADLVQVARYALR